MTNILPFKKEPPPEAGGPPQPPRWRVVIDYRASKPPNTGPYSIARMTIFFEELTELDEAVEQGPDFYCIKKITITLNPARMSGYRPKREEAHDA